jgi:flagellar biosynthesis protein
MANQEKHKKIKKVAAIRYDANDKAPSIIAKGVGVIGENLLEKGIENDIPVYEDEKLVETLTKLEIGDYIPPELYKVVAEIMVFVSDVDRLYDKTK